MVLSKFFICIECAQDLWTSFKRHMLKLFRKEVEEDTPQNSENESGTVKMIFKTFFIGNNYCHD